MPGKICLVASQGGHLQQMIRLSPVFDSKDHFLITTETVLEKTVNHGIAQVYVIPDINEGRGVRNPFLFFKALRKTFNIFRVEMPSLIISTGSGVAVPAFIIARLMGIPSIYVESYARIRNISMAGKVCYRLTKHFYVQHEGLCKHYRRAKYYGSVF